MRVYFVSHSAAPEHLGGAELSLLHLMDSWRRLDPALEPTLVAPSRRAALVAEAERRGYTTFVTPYEGWALFADPAGRPEAALRTHRDFASTRRLIARMSDERPALVVTNTIVAPWGAYAAAALGIPHVWFVREFGLPEHGFRFPVGRDAALADIGMLSTRVIANSEAVRDALAHSIPPEKLAVAYPGIDVAAVRELAQAAPTVDPFPLPDAALRLVVVGRLTRAKGQWRVLEALGILRARGIRVAACFVGAVVESDAEHLLRHRAAALGVGDAITFVGERSNPFPYVAAADVGINPSAHEAFGRTTLEYLLLDRPVIATHAGGSAEIVSPDVGVLVDPDDLDALTDALATYALDPALRARHGAAARARGEALAGSTTVEDLIGLLVEASRTPGHRLPQTVVGWLDVPGLFASTPSVALRRAVSFRHFGRRLRAALRHPVATFRRRWIRRRSRVR